MTITTQTAQDDLAFMKAIVTEGSSYERGFGLVYGAAGLLYGLQCLINGWMLIAAVAAPTWVWLALGILPTVGFVLVLIYNSYQRRGEPAFGTSTSRRAVTGAFAGGGIANLVLAALFGWVAYQKGDWAIWFLYPVVVAALQGALWFTASVIRRQVWSGVTAAAWFVSAIVLGLVMNDTNTYITALGVILLLCMALPGYVIKRGAAHPNPATEA